MCIPLDGQHCTLYPANEIVSYLVSWNNDELVRKDALASFLDIFPWFATFVASCKKQLSVVCTMRLYAEFIPSYGWKYGEEHASKVHALCTIMILPFLLTVWHKFPFFIVGIKIMSCNSILSYSGHLSKSNCFLMSEFLAFFVVKPIHPFFNLKSMCHSKQNRVNFQD